MKDLSGIFLPVPWIPLVHMRQPACEAVGVVRRLLKDELTSCVLRAIV
jgi:hypothetical protein